MVMLVLSVVTGSAAQVFLLYFRKQTLVVNETLTNLLIEAGITKENAETVIKEILKLNDKNTEDEGKSPWYKKLNEIIKNLPDAMLNIPEELSNLSKSGSNKYISREELVLYLLRKAAKEESISNNGSFSQDLFKIQNGSNAEEVNAEGTSPAKSAFNVANDAIADILKNIEKGILKNETDHPEKPSAIWRADAIKEYAPNLAAKIFIQFDEYMDRSDDIVSRYGKLITTIVALPILLMFWPVDSIQLINKLNNDKTLSQKIADNIDKAYVNTWNTVQKENSACFNADTPKDEKQKSCKKYGETINELANSQLDDLNITLGLFGENRKDSCDIYNIPCVMGSIWNNLTFGIFITWIFISMGSAFWLGLLNKMLGIRSELGKKLEDQRAIRATRQQD